MSNQRIGAIVLLVGGNPLPNYVAACALRARCGIASVHLLFTDEVREVKNNLSTCLRKRGFQCHDNYIADAANVAEIRRACRSINSESSLLHYTGGTNAMAIHAYIQWNEQGGIPSKASYLSEKDDQLILDDGGRIEIENVQLDLQTLVDLHGLELNGLDKEKCNGPIFPDDANKVASAVFKEPDLAGKLYCENRYITKKGPPCPNAPELELSETSIPNPNWDTSKIKSWRRFLRGEWLEHWVSQKMMETGLISRCNLHVGIKPKIQKREFELDVVAIRKHHLYVISCTTDRTAGRCKLKLFEVALRARQLGGDLARSALVCLADRSESGDDIVSGLREDVRSFSKSFKEPEVFGLKHVKEWAGTKGSSPQLKSLERWLKDAAG